MVTIAMPEASIQERFLEDCRSVALKRGLEFITIPPDSAPLPITRVAAQSWQDEADLFALKWKVTYEVIDGYLIVGHQFVHGCYNRSQEYSVHVYSPDQESAVLFIETLEDAQIGSLRETGRLPFSLLSTEQCEKLESVLRAGGNTYIGAINPEAPGYVRLLIDPYVWVCSNGRPIGTMMVEGGKISYEADDEEWPQKTPNSLGPEVILGAADHLFPLPQIVRTVASACKPLREVTLDRDLGRVDASVYSATAKIPFSVGWAFVTRSLDLGIRELQKLRHVGHAYTLPVEGIELKNVDFVRRVLQRIAPALPAATFTSESEKKLWHLLSSIFLSGRAQFRVELPRDLPVKLATLNPGIP